MQTSHDTLGGSFVFGIMTAILSTPCTAPLMGAAAAWATTQAVPRSTAEGVRRYSAAIVAEARASRDAIGRPHVEPDHAAASRWMSPMARLAATSPVETRTDALLDPAIPEKCRTLLAALDLSFLERRQHVRAALLALLSGQHALLIGPPGTGKSMMARALCACFADASYFEYLLSRFTTPDEIFGPVSIPGLKNEDYRRLTQGFLPSSHIAFLDEIFKANSAILNALLTLINERVFHHGNHRDTVPLIGLLGASNELPDPEGGLGALYDRFLVRLAVPPLAESASFLRLVTGDLDALEIPPEARLTADDLDALRRAAPSVKIGARVRSALLALWDHAAMADWGISDRRWRQAVQMLRIAVAADGRRSMDLVDLTLLEPVLTPDPSQSPQVRELILRQLGPEGVPQHDLRAQWTLARFDRVAPTANDPNPKVAHTGLSFADRLAVRKQTLDRFLELHAGAVTSLGDERERLERRGRGHLWLPPVPVALLTPHIEGARDLARILKVARSYRSDLDDSDAVIGSLLTRLPVDERARGRAVSTPVGIGQHLAVGVYRGQWTRLVDPWEGRPVLRLEADAFLQWLALGGATAELVGPLDPSARHELVLRLEALRAALSGSLIPDLPPLPPP